jgi:hypothetical protein
MDKRIREFHKLSLWDLSLSFNRAATKVVWDLLLSRMLDAAFHYLHYNHWLYPTAQDVFHSVKQGLLLTDFAHEDYQISTGDMSANLLLNLYPTVVTTELKYHRFQNHSTDRTIL